MPYLIFDTHPLPFVELNRSGKITRVNPSAHRRFEALLPGKSLRDCLNIIDEQGWLELLKCLENRKPYSMVYLDPTTGQPEQLYLSAMHAGSPFLVCLTDPYKTRQTLSLNQIDLLTQNYTIPILVVSLTERIILGCNLSAQRFFDCSLDKLGKKKLDDVLALFDAEKIFNTKSAYHHTFTLAHGEPRELELRHSSITLDDGRPAALLFITDNTELYRANKALETSEHLQKRVLENTSEAILIISDDNIAFFNDRLIELTGIERITLSKLKPYELIEKSELATIYKELEDTDISIFPIDTKIIGTEWKNIWVHIEASFIEWGEKKALMMFISDITSQRIAQELLMMNRMRYKHILESIPYGIMEINLEGVITFANKAVAKMLGLLNEAIQGRPFWEVVHRNPRNIEYMRSMFLQAIEGEPLPTSVELKYLYSDGREFDVNVDWVLLDDNSNKPYEFLCVITDISKQKYQEKVTQASLRQKDVLLREIHHRVKNNLQVVYSLLDMQELRFSDIDFKNVFRESKNRIMAMALTHEKLYESKDLSRINANEYLISLVKQVQRTYGGVHHIETNYNIENLTFNIAMALPIGLMTNELVSNALKHAFYKTESPKIYIGLSKKNEYITLKITDNGNGIPDNVNIEQLSSLGLQLVFRLTKQLGGTIDLQSDGNGTDFLISIPLES